MAKKTLLFCLLFQIICMLSSSLFFLPVFSADEKPVEEKKMDKAIWLFKHENYEEALVPLQELRAEDPQSGMIAYYLGVTLKQLQRLKDARPHLEAAAALTPKIGNAVPELIDLLYKLDRLDEAKGWIDVAEKEGAAPSQTAFMKGLILLKEDKDIPAAIAAFDKAQSLDESLAGMAKYYKGLAYLQAKDLSNAKEVFKEVVMATPGQGLAAYANEYMDTISRVEDAAKPFHGYAQAVMQYDDNVVLMPGDESAISGISEKADWRQSYTAQCDYNFKFGDTASIKPGYSFYYGKESNLGFYDMTSHDVTLLPSLYFDKLAITFPTHYNYVTVNDKGYLSVVGISNVNNYMVDRVNMAQFSFLYNRKIFLWQPNPAEERRTSNEYIGSLGWYRFFAKNKGVFSLSYVLNHDDAQGRDWRYFGNHLIMFSTIPVLDRLKWTVGLDYFNEYFPKRNVVYDKERYDNILTVSNLVAIEVFKNAEVLIQHSFIDDCASLGIYKYRRNVYGAGMKYKF
ncbi:MAG: tetratricopeptide repeat protein [Candidatus Omnitrophica bacterium]|nr:tetratricopeptide repeat protein [Candidatus Omnitrophota bacterium]